MTDERARSQRLRRLVDEGRQLRTALHIAVVEASLSGTTAHSPSLGIATAVLKVMLGSKYLAPIKKLSVAARLVVAIATSLRQRTGRNRSGIGALLRAGLRLVRAMRK